MKTKNIKSSKNEILEKRIYTKLQKGKLSNSYFVFFVPIRFSLILVFFVLFRFSLIFQTPGEWTWVHGDNTPNALGVFGTQGVPNPANKPPALYEPCEWTDNNGNFWLFGGGNNGINEYAALWKYDPTINQWTWVKGPFAVNQPGIYGTQGVPSPANYPCSRGWGAITWVDDSGNLWLFGGFYSGAGRLLNDLWKYDIAANEWTWMKGYNSGSYGTQGVSSPANLPPERNETSCSWTDNAGNFWLYGGLSLVGAFGDLWKYDVSINEWTWMHGANTLNPPTVYGTQGLANPTNTPGGRAVYCSWTDLSGNLWLFGGLLRNDLWKYDIVSNQWTWMKGSNTLNNPGNYGTKCVPAINNIPPARHENRARVRDTCGNFWNFGGGIGGSLNDLWHYNVSTNQWTWVSGDSMLFQAAVYGTQGISAPGNKPGSKFGSVAWMDKKGSIWIFGGLSGGGLYNDLFRYVPDSACVPMCKTTFSSTITSTNILCNGLCNGTATVTPINGTSPYTYSWNTGAIQTTASATGLCAGTYTVTVIDTASNTTTATVTITQPSVLTATASATSAVCGNNNGTAIVIAAGGAPGYTYSWNPSGGTNATATGLGSGNYTATITDTNGCDTTQIVTVVSSGSITVTNQSADICDGSTYTLPGGTIVNTSGIYNDTLPSVGGCDSIITTNLTVNPNPMATVFSIPTMSGQVVTITQGQGVTLTASGGGTYNWSNGSNGSSITVTPLVTTVYCVTVTDLPAQAGANGCTDTACVTVTIEPIDCSNAGELYLPNAFSPNNDGENDKLRIYYGNPVCIKDFKLVIYNRWGEKVFETTDAAKQWDGSFRGKTEDTAVFVYYLKATLFLGEEIIRKGNISLVR